MSVEIVSDDNADVFICNTTEMAFGPVMEAGAGEFFVEWLIDDPRTYEQEMLKQLYDEWYTTVYTKEGEEDQAED